MLPSSSENEPRAGRLPEMLGGIQLLPGSLCHFQGGASSAGARRPVLCTPQGGWAIPPTPPERTTTAPGRPVLISTPSCGFTVRGTDTFGWGGRLFSFACRPALRLTDWFPPSPGVTFIGVHGGDVGGAAADAGWELLARVCVRRGLLLGDVHHHQYRRAGGARVAAQGQGPGHALPAERLQHAIRSLGHEAVGEHHV